MTVVSVEMTQVSLTRTTVISICQIARTILTKGENIAYREKKYAVAILGTLFRAQHFGGHKSLFLLLENCAKAFEPDLVV